MKKKEKEYMFICMQIDGEIQIHEFFLTRLLFYLFVCFPLGYCVPLLYHQMTQDLKICWVQYRLFINNQLIGRICIKSNTFKKLFS